MTRSNTQMLASLAGLGDLSKLHTNVIYRNIRLASTRPSTAPRREGRRRDSEPRWSQGSAPAPAQRPVELLRRSGRHRPVDRRWRSSNTPATSLKGSAPRPAAGAQRLLGHLFRSGPTIPPPNEGAACSASGLSRNCSASSPLPHSPAARPCWDASPASPSLIYRRLDGDYLLPANGLTWSSASAACRNASPQPASAGCSTFRFGTPLVHANMSFGEDLGYLHVASDLQAGDVHYLNSGCWMSVRRASIQCATGQPSPTSAGPLQLLTPASLARCTENDIEPFGG